MNLCDMRTVRDILAAFDTGTKKSYGQNFLINAAVPENIAASCCDRADSVIVEIGPGIGCLTAELAKRFDRVIAFEIDRTLIPVLQYTLGAYSNVEIICEDILKVDLISVLREKAAGKSVSVAANLPYYITTPILMRLLECGYPFDSITVMVQREVADRLCAAPGSADYGAITASLCYYGAPHKLFSVAAGNFMPAPKVDSAVVRIDLFAEKPIRPKDQDLMFKVIRAAFAQRRKTLVNALAAAFPTVPKAVLTEAVHACGQDTRIRGEQLSTAEFAALTDILLPYLS